VRRDAGEVEQEEARLRLETALSRLTAAADARMASPRSSA
jgi:hypothetical protein